MFGDGWFQINDGDPRLVALYRRHYSSSGTSDNRRGIAGPGERICLMTADSQAGWVRRLYRRPTGARHGGKSNTYFGNYIGICCSFFRNERPRLSSTLIEEAVEFGLTRWPDEDRIFTFVSPSKVRSVNPGYCFKMAGWRKTGVTRGGLDILEYNK